MLVLDSGGLSRLSQRTRRAAALIEALQAERYHDPGDLDAAGFEHLYADTVAWYERYGVSMRPVPATLDDFRVTFDRFCVERLERTEAVQRLLQPDDRPQPVSGGGPLERLTAPILRRWGTLSTIGNLPPVIRERLGFDWTPRDQERLDRRRRHSGGRSNRCRPP